MQHIMQIVSTCYATVAFRGPSWGGCVCHFGALSRLLAHRNNPSWATYGGAGGPPETGAETCSGALRDHSAARPAHQSPETTCAEFRGILSEPSLANFRAHRCPSGPFCRLAEFCGVLPEPSLACLRAGISCTRTCTNMNGYGGV